MSIQSSLSAGGVPIMMTGLRCMDLTPQITMHPTPVWDVGQIFGRMRALRGTGSAGNAAAAVRPKAWRSILKSTSWVCGADLSTLERGGGGALMNHNLCRTGLGDAAAVVGPQQGSRTLLKLISIVNCQLWSKFCRRCGRTRHTSSLADYS